MTNENRDTYTRRLDEGVLMYYRRKMFTFYFFLVLIYFPSTSSLITFARSSLFYLSLTFAFASTFAIAIAFAFTSPFFLTSIFALVFSIYLLFTTLFALDLTHLFIFESYMVTCTSIFRLTSALLLIVRPVVTHSFPVLRHFISAITVSP